MRRNTKASLRYAKALFELSKEKNNSDRINEDMLLISKSLEENKELQVFLNDPTQKVGLKLKVLESIFGNKISKITTNLFALLIGNKRISLLKEITTSYQLIFDEASGVETVYVTTAVSLNSSLEYLILEIAKKESGKKEIIIKSIIDPTIIGGCILKIGDVEYNDSISNKLSLLKRNFDNSVFESKI